MKTVRELMIEQGYPDPGPDAWVDITFTYGPESGGDKWWEAPPKLKAADILSPYQGGLVNG